MPTFTTTTIMSSQNSNLSGRGPLRLLEDRSSSHRSKSTRLSLELDNYGTIDEERWLNERSKDSKRS
ncbi:hypothetical protein D5086_003045 [Populus alba]|uniref:Uncharacterized protein n=1 Tax=Populus alba TaxID=43335 RepID=A0ACC4D4E1_POPAL